MINNPSKGQEIPEMGSGRFPDGGYFFFARAGQKNQVREPWRSPACIPLPPTEGRQRNLKDKKSSSDSPCSFLFLRIPGHYFGQFPACISNALLVDW